MKKLLLLLVAVLTIGLAASAQTRTVSGTVLGEEDGEPIIGASVIPYGETKGVQTDIDGNFIIQVAPGVTKLNFAYVGMQPQTVNIPASGKMKVYMKSASNVLDDVIVVAYGTTTKAAYTGSAAVVDASQLEDAMVSNVTNAFSGKMAGVQTFSSNGQPGTGSTVRIRGVGSINAGTSPLYVVDGMPYDGDIAALATNDIESITVLKDAASTALYGARGANGVILVTTKKGKVGDAKVTVDMRWGSNSRAIPQYDVITNQKQFIETAYQALRNTGKNYKGYSDYDAHVWANENLWGSFGYQTWTIPAGQWTVGENGKFNPYATPGYSNGKYYFIADDWTKETLINGLRQEYQLGIQGGNDKINYYISGSYLEDQGIIDNSHFNRLSTRASIDYQAKSWLKIGTNMTYTYTNSAYPASQTNEDNTSSGNAFYFINGLAPIFPFYIRNADGSIMINENYGNKVYDYGDGANYGNGMVGFTRTPTGNPAGSLIYDITDYLSDIFDGKWYANITPLEGLSIQGTLGYHVDNTRTHQVLNPVYGQFAAMGGEAVQAAERYRSLMGQGLVSYDKYFDKHHINALAGYEYQSFQTEYTEAIGANLYNPTSFVVNNTIDQRNGYGAQSNLVHIGWVGRLNYDFANKYFVSASIRRDASSRFAPEHRWGTFWSASAGWAINQESFMQDVTWVDLLKFKVSFGQNGNDVIGANYIAYADQYKLTGSDGVFNNAELYYKGNRDITWETSNSFNTGFDFALWNGKLQGSIEYYSRQVNDMLFNIPTAPSLGYSSFPMNVGSMRNYGAELDLTYTVFQNRNITWDVFANITFGKNKVTKLDPRILNDKGEWISGSRIMREGESMYQLYIPEYAGVSDEGVALYYAMVDKIDADGNIVYDTTKPVLNDKGEPELDLDGNPLYETVKEEKAVEDYTKAYNTNRKSTGDLMPKAYGGFGTSVKAYGFDLSMQFAYQLGGKIIDSSYQSYMQPGTSLTATMHKDLLNAWTPENTNTDIPALYTEAKYNYATSTSTRFLTSSNYLSLNNVTLGYTLPKSIVRKLQLSGIRVYCAAENVALWSKRKGLDPRQGFTASDNSTYSPIRTISGGIRVEF